MANEWAKWSASLKGVLLAEPCFVSLGVYLPLRKQFLFFDPNWSLLGNWEEYWAQVATVYQSSHAVVRSTERLRWLQGFYAIKLKYLPYLPSFSRLRFCWKPLTLLRFSRFLFPSFSVGYHFLLLLSIQDLMWIFTYLNGKSTRDWIILKS